MTTGLYNENVVKSILITQKSYSNNLKWAVLKKKKNGRMFKLLRGKLFKLFCTLDTLILYVRK